MYAIIDIEATGGSPKKDRITEIAIFLYENNQIIDSFCTLINPQVSIPPFINKLTGINDEMVADAPTFQEVAPRIIEITKNAVFVAHNVQFDYAYLRAEFKRVGYRFDRSKACTVNLAKQILPGHESYSLGNLCRDLGIEVENRHRAFGDARATVELFKILEQKDPDDYIAKAISEIKGYKHLPPNLPTSIVEQLPEDVGVYYIHGANNKIIYISRSSDIRRRVIQHFTTYNEQIKSKQWKMFRNAHDVSCEITGSELIAQILEAHEVNLHAPSFNRSRHIRKLRYGLFKYYDAQTQLLQLQVRKLREGDQPILAFPKEEHGNNLLFERIANYSLCPILCGIETPKRVKQGYLPCSQYSVGGCKGACIGKERVATYNRRARRAIKDLEFPYSSFLIVGEGRNNEEISIVYIDDNQFVGYHYFHKDIMNESDAVNIIIECIEPMAHSSEYNRIIRNYLKKNQLDKIIRLDIPQITPIF